MVPALLLAAVLGLQQPAPASDLRLDHITVVGTKRYTAAEIVRMSGLVQGQVVTTAGVQKAGQQLVGSGLFKSLRYRHEVTDGQGHLTLVVEEEDWKTPVVFDNFVWFTDDELTAAVRAEVPSFDRTAPANEHAAAFIGQALQRVIEARRIPGQVQVRDRLNVRTGVHESVYKVNSPGLQLCSLRLPGATRALESLLQQAAKDDVIGRDYSRAFLIDFAEGTLRQIYLKRGYLRAAFGAPAAATDGACAGITVTMPVEEGLAYTWAAAEWVGAAAIAAKDLDGLIRLKRGQVSDLTAIDEGLRAVQTAYEKIGHLERRVTVAPRLDDAARTAVPVITIAEGAQYRMGAIEFVGFPAAKAAELLKKWRLKSGDIFDGTYQPQFEREQFATLRVSGERRINTATHNVDVRFTLK